jgi:exodeoxyribonuclease VIII
MLAKKINSQAVIYENISNDDYHSIPGLSATGISLLLDCPKKYKLSYIDGMKKDAPHFQLGKLIHTLLLEPNTFENRYFVIPMRAKRTKKVLDDIKLKYGNVEVITHSIFNDAKEQVESIKEHPLMKELLTRKLNIEHSIIYYDNELGIDLKTRPDIYTENIIIDIKHTKSVKPLDFSKAIYEYGYHRQACLALDGLEAATGRRYNNFIFLAVEKTPPFCVEAYVLSRDDGSRLRYDSIEHGRREIIRAAQLYKKCMETNIWPSYTDKIVEINLPYWAQMEVI